MELKQRREQKHYLNFDNNIQKYNDTSKIMK